MIMTKVAEYYKSISEFFPLDYQYPKIILVNWRIPLTSYMSVLREASVTNKKGGEAETMEEEEEEGRPTN